MINIKKILAPTDFSTHAEHALQYAGELAKNLKAKDVRPPRRGILQCWWRS